jgi:hypothetical protein
MDDISIDRLILEIPGLTAAQGKELAQQIGAQLAASTAGPGTFQTLSVRLQADDVAAKNAPGDASGAHATASNPAAAPHPQRLATQIVAALLRQIG